MSFILKLIDFCGLYGFYFDNLFYFVFQGLSNEISIEVPVGDVDDDGGTELNDKQHEDGELLKVSMELCSLIGI